MSESNKPDNVVSQSGEPAAGQPGATPSTEQLAERRKVLVEQQEQVRRKLDQLEVAAARAETELSAVEERREQFQLVARACSALEVLSQQGVAELFWGDDSSAAERYLHDARDRVRSFNAELKQLEAKHQAAVGQVTTQQQQADELDYDLDQVLQEEESRLQEWVVERDETLLPVRRIAMPWTRGFEEDKRFHRNLAGSMVAALLLGLIIPLIDLPIPEREELVEVPERFAKLIREPQRPIPPPVAQEIPEPEEIKPQEIKPEEVQPQPKKDVAVKAKPKPTKEKVNSVGILAFRKNFSNLNSRPAAKLGSKARVSNAGDKASNRPQRAMVTAQGSGSSGGINLAAVSRDIGGGGVELVEGVALTQAESSIGGGGPDGRIGGVGGVAGRTDEEIQIVFDRYKAALYRLYNRELRNNPTLRGQMVLRLTIEPDGSVSLCRVQSTDLESPALAERVVASVRGFDFGPKDVPPVTILYPIDFLPTA